MSHRELRIAADVLLIRKPQTADPSENNPELDHLVLQEMLLSRGTETRIPSWKVYQLFHFLKDGSSSLPMPLLSLQTDGTLRPEGAIFFSLERYTKKE